MPKRGDKEFLLDIIEAIKRIELYTKELSYPDFFLILGFTPLEKAGL